jgi:hypothetical protein
MSVERELIRAPRPWYNDLSELAAFLRWLIETTQVTDRPWDVVEKPWKFESEHETYLREEAAERLADEDEAFAELERRRGPA